MSLCDMPLTRNVVDRVDRKSLSEGQTSLLTHSGRWMFAASSFGTGLDIYRETAAGRYAGLTPSKPRTSPHEREYPRRMDRF